MTIRATEVGKDFRYSTGLDLSSFTGLTLNFTKPNGTDTLQKTNASVNPVSAPAIALVNDPDLGNVPASTYMQFTSIATDFDPAGEWTVCGIYADSVAVQIFHGADATFTVEDSCT